MQLICDSVRSASARIRFFRIAFGAASDDPVVRNEVTSILTEMFDGGRLAVKRGTRGYTNTKSGTLRVSYNLVFRTGHAIWWADPSF